MFFLDPCSFLLVFSQTHLPSPCKDAPNILVVLANYGSWGANDMYISFHYQCWLVLGYEVHIIYWIWLVKANFKLWGAYIILILINISQFWVMNFFFFIKFKVACLCATRFFFQFLWCNESGIGWTLKPYFSYPKMTKIWHNKKHWHLSPIRMLSWKPLLNKLLVCGHIHIIQF